MDKKDHLILRRLHYRDKLEEAKNAIRCQIRILELGQQFSFSANTGSIILDEHPLIKPMMAKIAKYSKLVEDIDKQIEDSDG